MNKVAFYEEVILGEVFEKEAGYIKNTLVGAGAGALGGATGGALRAKIDSKKKGETKEEARKRMKEYVCAGALPGALIGSSIGLGKSIGQSISEPILARREAAAAHKKQLEYIRKAKNGKINLFQSVIS